MAETTKPVTTLVAETAKPVTTVVAETTKPVTTLVAETTKPVTTLVADTTKPVTTLVADTTKPVTTLVADDDQADHDADRRVDVARLADRRRSPPGRAPDAEAARPVAADGRRGRHDRALSDRRATAADQAPVAASRPSSARWTRVRSCRRLRPSPAARRRRLVAAVPGGRGAVPERPLRTAAVPLTLSDALGYAGAAGAAASDAYAAPAATLVGLGSTSPRRPRAGLG